MNHSSVQTSHSNPYNTAKANVPNNPKAKKSKKLLWILLGILLLIIGIVVLVINSNKKADELLKRHLTEQSIVYSGFDYKDYVTQDIGIPKEISPAKDKSIPIQWLSDEADILTADGKVQRPTGQNQTVTLTASIRHGLGKSKESFTFQVIKSDTIDESDVYVLSPEELESGEAEHNLVVGYEDSGEIFSIYGNFGKTKVSSMEDALVVVDQYRSILHLDDSYHFEASKILPAKVTKTYELQQVIGGVPYWNRSIVLTVDENDYLRSINLQICRNTNVDPNFSLSQAELDALATKALGCDAIAWMEEKGIHAGAENTAQPAYHFYAIPTLAEENDITEATSCYRVTANALTKEIIYKGDSVPMLMDVEFTRDFMPPMDLTTTTTTTTTPPVHQIETAPDNMEELITQSEFYRQIEVSSADVFGNQQTFTVFRVGTDDLNIHYFYDPFRKIKIVDNRVMMNDPSFLHYYNSLLNRELIHEALLYFFTVCDVFSQDYSAASEDETPQEMFYRITEELRARIQRDSIQAIVVVDALNSLVKSMGLPAHYHTTPNYSNPQAVSSYINLQQTYDWYMEHFNRDSIDGKGKLLTCVVNADYMVDNAAFFGMNGGIFLTGPAKNIFTYAPCGGLDTMAHEFTHGVYFYVVGDLDLDKDATDGNTWMRTSIDEGYADIFGCLVEGNWKMGETVAPVVMRDPTGTEENLLGGNKYPERYYGEHWNMSDGHINGILLSRAAYQMTQQGFTEDEVADIWYQSMFYQYTALSDFLDVRYNVIQAARTLGHSPEKIKVIEDIFGLMGIGAVATRELVNGSIPGHMLLDDVAQENFIVQMIPFTTYMGLTSWHIYQKETDAPAQYTDEEISEMMTAGVSYNFSTDRKESYDPSLPITKTIKVKYKRLPKWQFNIRAFWINLLQSHNDAVLGEAGIKEEGNEILQFFVFSQVHECTAHDMWVTGVGVNFRVLKEMGYLD